MLNPAQRWATALAAMYFKVNHREPSFLTGVQPSPQELDSAKRSLASNWGATNREELLARLDFLTSRGHRTEYEDLCATEDEARNNPALQFAPDPELDAKRAFVAGHRARLGPRSLFAWDAARLVLIASWGVELGWITLDEMMRSAVPMAMKAQATHQSWQDYGECFLLGREYWSGKGDDRFRSVVAELAATPTSLWNTAPWSTDLSLHGVVAPLASVEAPRGTGALANVLAPDPHAHMGLQPSPEQQAQLSPQPSVSAVPPTLSAIPPTQLSPVAPMAPKKSNLGLILALALLGLSLAAGATAFLLTRTSPPAPASDAKPASAKTASAVATAQPKPVKRR